MGRVTSSSNEHQTIGVTYLFLLIYSFVVKQEVGLINSPVKTKYLIFFMGVIEVSKVALVNYGLTIGDAILITPVASALSIVTITLAVFFLKFPEAYAKR